MEISEKLWDESRRGIEARFERNERDIDELYKRQCEIEKLSIQIGEMLKNHHKTQEDHGKRIEALEKRPVKFFDKIVSGIIGAATGSLTGALISLFIK
ncbi:MAG: hypothetical protein GX264_04535 [Clostridiales bacterium]|jgi:predicted Holliday junction resolvase-like endonuclease|nr:hypothetical protein [Clostridiales bacterium]